MLLSGARKSASRLDLMTRSGVSPSWPGCWLPCAAPGTECTAAEPSAMGKADPTTEEPLMLALWSLLSQFLGTSTTLPKCESDSEGKCNCCNSQPKLPFCFLFLRGKRWNLKEVKFEIGAWGSGCFPLEQTSVRGRGTSALVSREG